MEPAAPLRSDAPGSAGDLSGSPPEVRLLIVGDALIERLSALLASHPDARVLFLVRDVAEAVAEVIAHPGLMRRADAGTPGVSPERAARRWRSTVKRAERIEIAYGSDRVLRVRHPDLLADPEAALTRCMTFLGETFLPRQLRAFRHAGAGNGLAPGGSAEDVRAALAPDLLEFSARLLAAPLRHLPARPDRIARLEAATAEPSPD